MQAITLDEIEAAARIVYIDYNAVARGGIEPPTHGFSVRKHYFSRLFSPSLIFSTLLNFYLVL